MAGSATSTATAAARAAKGLARRGGRLGLAPHPPRRSAGARLRRARPRLRPRRSGRRRGRARSRRAGRDRPRDRCRARMPARAARERPQHGENRRRGHQREQEPQRHGGLTSRRPPRRNAEDQSPEKAWQFRPLPPSARPWRRYRRPWRAGPHIRSRTAWRRI